MITNERQYRLAKAEAQKFEQAIAVARAREPTPGVDPRVHEAMAEALESELAILQEQLEYYGARKGRQGQEGQERG